MPLAGVGVGLDIKSGERAEENTTGNEKHSLIYLWTYDEPNTLLDSREAKMRNRLSSPLNLTFKEIKI